MWIILLLLLILILYWMDSSNEPKELGNWEHLFEKVQIDPDEFYPHVEAELEKRHIASLRKSRGKTEESDLAKKNQYLALVRRSMSVQICAVSYGEGCFIFWKAMRQPNSLRNILLRPSAKDSILPQDDSKGNFLQLVQDRIFLEKVHSSILEALDRLAASKGWERLNESERVAHWRVIQ